MENKSDVPVVRASGVAKPVKPLGPDGVSCCNTCKFHVALNGMDNDTSPYKDCRVDGPVALSHSLRFQQTEGLVSSAQNKYFSSWPRSHKFDWCGRHIPK